MTKNILILMTMLSTISCSTMRDSLLTGIGSGAALGAAGGSLSGSHDKKKATIAGALIGAAIGGIGSYFLHKKIKRKEEKIRRDTLFNLDRHDVSAPLGFKAKSGYGHGVSMPMVESEWVDTQVKGKKLVEGHRIWMITEDAKWIPSKEVKK